MNTLTSPDLNDLYKTLIELSTEFFPEHWMCMFTV